MNKNIYFIIIIAVAFLSSCTDKKKQISEQIQQLENSDTSSSPEGLKALSNLYISFYENFPEDIKSSMYLHTAAMYEFLLKNYSFSKQISLDYLNKFPNGKELHPTLINLAKIYALDKEKLDSSIYFFNKGRAIKALTVADMNEMALVYENIAKSSSDSSSIANNYFQAALAYQQTAMYQGAITNYINGFEAMPTHPKAPDALQTIAFLYENELSDIGNAKKYYALLAESYPNSKAGQDAAFLVKNNLIGKSAEEILEFSLKNKNN